MHDILLEKEMINEMSYIHICQYDLDDEKILAALIRLSI